MDDVNRISKVLNFSTIVSRNVFLSSFELEMKIMNAYRKPIDFNDRDIKIIFEIPKLLQSLDSSTSVPLRHCKAIGKFIGILRFHPHNILTYRATNGILEVMQALFLHPWFKFYIAGILTEWVAIIKSINPPLQEYEKKEFEKYVVYLSNLGAI